MEVFKAKPKLHLFSVLYELEFVMFCVSFMCFFFFFFFSFCFCGTTCFIQRPDQILSHTKLNSAAKDFKTHGKLLFSYFSCVFSHISVFSGYCSFGLHTGSAEGAASSSDQYRMSFTDRMRRPRVHVMQTTQKDRLCFVAVLTGKMVEIITGVKMKILQSIKAFACDCET